MNVIYTEPAKQELITFQENQRRLLEELVAEKKFVFGDEQLEITASDIKETADRFRPYHPRERRRYHAMRFGAQIYILLGIVLMLGAIFYPNLKKMFQEGSPQGFL